MELRGHLPRSRIGMLTNVRAAGYTPVVKLLTLRGLLCEDGYGKNELG